MEEKDYKKLYEDVVALAKDGLKDGLYLSHSAKEVTEFLFPQLKETEDEKAKRELTTFLIDFNNGYYSRPSESKINSWIKWIDTQGKKTVDNTESKFKVGDWIVDNENGEASLIRKKLKYGYLVFTVDENYTFNEYYRPYDYAEANCHLWAIQDAKDGDALVVGDEDCTGIAICGKNDKLGNNILYCYYDDENGFAINIPIDLVCLLHPATKEQCDLLFQKIHEEGYEWDAENKKLIEIEKQSYQKPIEESEPKFNVGDWIINKHGISWHIDSFDKKNYQVSNVDGEYCYFPISKQDEVRLWTIDDAKDGDVLVVNNEVFIYAHRKQMYSIAVAHCFVDSAGGFYFDGEFGYMENGNLTSLATKEQRDLLFQKMKEAGYEWDTKKKELKKIENNSSITEELTTVQQEYSEEEKAKMDDKYIPSLDDAAEEYIRTASHADIGLRPIPFNTNIKDLYNRVDIKRAFKAGAQHNYDKGYGDGYSAAKYNQWKPTDKQMEDFGMLLDYNIGVFDYSKFMSAKSLYEDLKKNLIK